MRPALDQERMLPTGSVMATMVLLNVAAIEATPCGTFFRSLRLVPARRAPAFGALAVAIGSSGSVGGGRRAVGRRTGLLPAAYCLLPAISWSLSSCRQP